MISWTILDTGKNQSKLQSSYRYEIPVKLQKNYIALCACQMVVADPFENFKDSLDEVTKDVLSEDELGRLYSKQLFLERLELVRDIFLFSCYTGLAYADVSNLSVYDIQPGG